MATNKNAIIRYQTLDRCFRNPGRKYFINDLINKCNEALLDVDPKSTGIKRRQIYDDINFMRDSRGFEAPVEAFKEGKKVFYRYDDMSFSINNQPLNEQEAQQLQESLLTLSRFKGMPQFEWVEELSARLEQSFKLKSDMYVISFEENAYLRGIEYIGVLYNAIVNNQVLKIQYQPFGKDTIAFDLHPYHLKQYNNRWFLFGLSTGLTGLTNVPLDRINSITESETKYIPNKIYDFEEIFEDVIGVTIPENMEPKKIILKIDKNLWPYIETKPLHGSQRKMETTDDYILIQLEVHLNYELEALILSRGEQIEVLSPTKLRDKLKKRAVDLYKLYK